MPLSKFWTMDQFKQRAFLHRGSKPKAERRSILWIGSHFLCVPVRPRERIVFTAWRYVVAEFRIIGVENTDIFDFACLGFFYR